MENQPLARQVDTNLLTMLLGQQAYYEKQNHEFHSRVWPIQIPGHPPLALKAIKAKHAQAAELLYREHEFLLALAHPNIVTYAFHGFLDEHYIIATQWLDGFVLADNEQALAQIVDNPKAEQRFLLGLEAMQQVLLQHGICHRDVWEKNILVCSGQPVLIDFGWAKFATEASAYTPQNLRQADDLQAFTALKQKLANCLMGRSCLISLMKKLTRLLRTLC